jgi:hypothetical protein
LTATNQLVRQTNLLSMFRAVGQVMHLLEDASQGYSPQGERATRAASLAKPAAGLAGRSAE